MKENEVAISFNESYVRDKIAVPSADGGSYELYIIEMPDEEGDKKENRRTFTVPVSRLYTDKKKSYIKFVYLLKDKKYRVLRAKYDSEARTTRVDEVIMMTGQDIKDVFIRHYENQKKLREKSVTPKKEEGNN